MGRITPVHHRKLEAVVQYVGCEFVRQEGFHKVYQRSDLKRPVIIPCYQKVPVFIIKNNLRLLGLSNEQYLKILNSL